MKQRLNYKKKMIYFGIIGVLLLIGVSYAIWQLNFTQDSSNTLSVACFSVTYSEQDNISLLNTYPMLDSEGKNLTPYQVTIKNNCSEYGAYQVNLEVLNTTTLDSAFVKIMFDEQDPKLLTSYPVVEKTLSDATSAYKMTTGYLKPNEERTYTLRLWLDENVTLEDHVEGKKFASKITIANTYKANAPSALEECESLYGEGASVCNIIASAGPTNEKCLQLDENGYILNPYSKMDDNDTPIVCSMEDDYGTSFYFRGNHQDNNVKFANMCWKLIRITGTGGYKLIYNGDLDENGKCTTTSGTHTGFTGQSLSLSGNKVYGTSYTYDGTTYTLTDTSTMNWTNASASIIGKYTCGNTNTSCANLYYVVSYESSSKAYVFKMGVSTNYAQIGASPFNSKYNSPAYVGYMYNDVYASIEQGVKKTILSVASSNTSNFYYGDTISYSGNYYYITNQDGSDVTQLSWADNYENNLVGKYTCRGTSKYNNTTLRCATAYKVVDTTTRKNYMISEYLTKGRLETGTIKISNDYIDNGNGTYTLNDTIVELDNMGWYEDSWRYYYYICDDWNQTTCSNLYKITSISRTYYEGIPVSDNFYYGSSFTYNEGAERPFTLTDPKQLWDTSDADNMSIINNHHYTCFYTVDNTCQELYFVYTISTASISIKLNGNETINDAVNKMLVNDDINVKNSTIKEAIDWWYEHNLLNTPYESYLEDTLFCNDRTIHSLGWWSETVPDGIGPRFYNNALYFNSWNGKLNLKCPNKRDAFTVNDADFGNAALVYPIGLLNVIEDSLLGSAAAQITGSNYWSITPDIFAVLWASGYLRGSNGTSVRSTNSQEVNGVRPSISLRPDITFKNGTDGTAANPYEVVME